MPRFDISVNEILKVTNKQGLKVYSSPNGDGKLTGQVLPYGSSWKVSRELNNGYLWLKVGTNQWIIGYENELNK
ncbi:hypothetical protein FC23_GL000635 [Lactobacillus psittaci DSM 15354]|uniref:SH3b domain-containing protein n=2 Tax=Lactobacillus psittaci TaxID=116089 RepID=A0A0R1SB97_9LACO|nr:hypothetical protein FC23_GL000635 [Lactobacillus psittaci DSM 15354]